MFHFDVNELRAIQKVRKLHQKQMEEIHRLHLKHRKALLDLSQKLGINLDKSLKREFYRKLIHLSSLWIPGLIYFVHPLHAVAIFSVIFVGNLFLEYANYRKWKWARKSFGVLFFKTLRKKETKRSQFQPSGSLYVLLAAIVCTLLFSKPIAMIALTVMLISDTSAALIGKAMGTRKIYRNKSLEGTDAFFVSALIVNMIYNPLYPFTYVSVLACMAAVVAEVFEDKIKIDDNISIPIFVGLILTFLG